MQTSSNTNSPAASPDRVVSFDDEPLILVDGDDRETGTLDKSACHDGDGVLHRAFSLFISNDRGELLMQQRAAGKRLWPLYWSNTCCSHPRAGETMDLAVVRRLEQELGMSAELSYLYKFQYQARYESLGSEHELCSVFLGQATSPPRPNKTELEDCRWVTKAQLNTWLADHPEQFTPWFKLEWQTLQEKYAAQLSNYLS